MLQNSPFGERPNMLYLIEITKLNGKSLRNGWNAPRIGQKGRKERGQEPAGRGGCSILKNTGERVDRSLRAGAFYIKKY